MPREVFRDIGVVPIIEISDSESEQDGSSTQKQSEHRSTCLPKVPAHPFVSRDEWSKTSIIKERDSVEIIELSSSSDEDVRHKPVPNPPNPTTPYKRQFSTRMQDTPSTPVRKTPTSAVRRKKFVIRSSEDEDNQTAPLDITPMKPKKDMTPKPFRADIVVGNDGIIQYVPTPRRRLAPLNLITNANEATPPSSPVRIPERRRTLLPPDSPRQVAGDLCWEHEEDAQGGIRSGAMLTHPTGDLDEDQTSPSKSASTLLSSPSKTPRRKKMPPSIAILHRLAIPYLKELDLRVFGGRLGAASLQEIELPTPGKKKRGQEDKSVIWGMGSVGEYNDGHGSYIELVWSNRMATTAGRTEYKKTPQGQIKIKIELGVKVITNEERLRHTLAHEACHAASWAISGDFKSPHGSTFKSWGRKVEAAFPDVQVTTKHDYEIDYKFTWKCSAPSCGHIFKRHSNSINLEQQGCSCGARLEPQFQLPVKRTPLKTSPGTSLGSTTLGNTNFRGFPRLLFSDEMVEDDLATAITSMSIVGNGADIRGQRE